MIKKKTLELRLLPFSLIIINIKSEQVGQFLYM